MADRPIALVTGGAGFIGSALVRVLLAAGWRVRVLDNFATGTRANLAGLDEAALEVKQGDVRDALAVHDACAGVDTVFHLACVGLRRALREPNEAHEVNASGSLIVARAALAAGVARYVHVSSSEVYGTALTTPMGESHPCLPTTVYGASKLAGEAYARSLHLSAGLPVVIVRPFNAFGPRCHHEGDAGEVIPKFLLRALAGQPLIVFGDGEQTRDFTYVQDAARGIAAAARAPEAVGRTINVGAGAEISVNALADRVLALAPDTASTVRHEPARPGDVRRLIADASLARDVLGWQPHMSFDGGLARLLAWYRSQGVAPEVLLRDEVERNWERAEDRERPKDQACANDKPGGSSASSAAASASANLIPIARPVVDDAEADAVRRVIRTGWITQGPEVERFEREFAEMVGARHAIAVSSGTTALHLALLAAGIDAGDEVITVSHSFIATANVVRYCGATPVFVDIEPATFNIDPALVEAAITPATRAILAVHQMGMPCDLARLLPIARRHRLIVIEDAACAIGSEIRIDGGWQRVGAPQGDIACFSLHPRKVLTTGDGGMITTARDDWAESVRRLRVHGMDVSAHARHTTSRVVFERYVELGYNFRMTDVQAAIGRVQLQRLPDIVAARRSLAARYREMLAHTPGVAAPFEPDWARSNWQSYCVRIDAAFDQREVMEQLLDRGIATRRGVMCAHREPAYVDAPEVWRCGDCDCGNGKRVCRRLPHSEAAQDHAMWIPLSPQMTNADQDRVVTALRDVCGATRRRSSTQLADQRGLGADSELGVDVVQMAAHSGW